MVTTPSSPVSGTRDATGVQIRGSSLLLVGQAMSAIVNLAAQILIVRYLSRDDYAVFAYALSIVVVADSVAAFGMARGVSRFLPLYEERGDLPRAAGTLIVCIITVLGLGLAVLLLVTGFRGAIVGSFAGDANAVPILILMTLLTPLHALAQLLDATFAVFARARAIFVRKYLLAPLSRLVVVGLLVLGGQGVIFLTAGYLVAGFIGLFVLIPFLIKTLRERHLLGLMHRGMYVLPWREIYKFTFPLLSSDLTAASMTAGGGVMLGLLSTPTDVADFRAVLPLVITMGYVLSSFGLLLVPLASRLYARADWEQLDRLYWRSAVWTAVLAFPIFIVCVAAADPLVALLFGDRYDAAAPVLAILAVGQFVNTAGGQNGLVLGVFGRVRFLAISNLFAIVVGFGLMYALIPPYAAVGAAVATSGTLIFLNVMRQVALARLTHVSGIVSEAVSPYLAMILGTVVAVAVTVGLSPPPLIAFAVIAITIVVVFAVARHVLALGETFPELTRIPLLRQIAGAGTRGRED